MNNPIAPHVFNRNKEIKYSLVKKWKFWDMTLFDLMSDMHLENSLLGSLNQSTKFL